jgi:dihydrofolate reductase
MVASLDGFISRRDGRVDFLDTADEYPTGATMNAEEIAAFLRTIDCYVMGSRTYETALGFEAQGHGWAYGNTPTVVLTSRTLARTRDTIEFHDGDIAELLSDRLRPRYRNIWIAGGAAVAAECLRRGLADELRYSVVPVAIGDGVRFFEGLDRDAALHLVETKAYRNGLVELRYAVRGGRDAGPR